VKPLARRLLEGLRVCANGLVPGLNKFSRQAVAVGEFRYFFRGFVSTFANIVIFRPNRNNGLLILRYILLTVTRSL
jgi:hypothetical protein